jgi:L-threonylcarbamoyladenylate synthase
LSEFSESSASLAARHYTRQSPRLSPQRAARVLRRGGVIAYPTEGVWGLGCDPDNALACERILMIKNRPWEKGLILVANDFDQLMPWITLPSNSAIRRAATTWPGPVTWLFPCADDCPLWLSGDHDTIAVRISDHPVVRALCHYFGGAIVSTSANRAGRDPALSATRVRLQLRSEIDGLVPGPLGGLEGPTPIRDVRSGFMLRR